MPNGSPLFGTRGQAWGANNGYAIGGPNPSVPPGTAPAMYIHIDVAGQPTCTQSGLVGFSCVVNGDTDSVLWWQNHHPECVVYTIDEKTPAYQEGDTLLAPWAIWDSNCRGYVMVPFLQAMLAAYPWPAVAIDNITDNNGAGGSIAIGTCSIKPINGCTADGGTFTPHYSGTNPDNTWINDHINWLDFVRSTIQAISAKDFIVGNLIYDTFDIPHTLAIAGHLDEWFQENGSWVGCSPWFSASDLVAYVGNIATYAATSGKAYWDNNYLTDAISGGTQCTAPGSITVKEKDFVLAVHLLIKGTRTFFSSNGYNTSGSFDDTSIWPWNYLVHGKSDAVFTNSSGVLNRSFGQGMVLSLVNTNAAPVTWTLPPGRYRQIDGTPHAGNVVLAGYDRTKATGAGMVLIRVQ